MKRRSSVERAAEMLGSVQNAETTTEVRPVTPTKEDIAYEEALAVAHRHAVTAETDPDGEAADADARAKATSQSAAIDMERLRSSGLVTSYSDRTQIAEEFRLIKRPLLIKAFADGPDAIDRGNLIMVTSSKPGEGKTFCAVSLAMSIALERDLTVLLIDADIAKPEVPSVLGVEAEKGLVDLIADDNLKLSDVLIRTDLGNLSILPAGRQHHLATELLASDKMEHFVNDIARRYPDRVIIFDSPPVLMSSIASVLAMHVGQTLFIVEAERTAQQSIDSALNLISSCKNISLLLNKVPPVAKTERFGSYYGYYR